MFFSIIIRKKYRNIIKWQKLLINSIKSDKIYNRCCSRCRPCMEIYIFLNELFFRSKLHCLIMLLPIFEILPNQNLQARLVSIPFMLLEKKIEIWKVYGQQWWTVRVDIFLNITIIHFLRPFNPIKVWIQMRKSSLTKFLITICIVNYF